MPLDIGSENRTLGGMTENCWADRIKEIEASGMSLKAIAMDIGLAISTVSDIKNGRTTEPRGMAAVALHELHKKRVASAKAKRKVA